MAIQTSSSCISYCCIDPGAIIDKVSESTILLQPRLVFGDIGYMEYMGRGR